MPHIVSVAGHACVRPLSLGVFVGHSRLFRIFHWVKIFVEYGSIVAISSLLSWATASVFLPKTIDYTFSDTSCTTVFGPIRSYGTKDKDFVFVAHKTSYLTHEICASASSLVTENRVVKVSAYHRFLPIQQTITIRTQAYPIPAPRLHTDNLLSTGANLLFDINSAEGHELNYALRMEDKQVLCDYRSTVVSCPVAQLDLAQGTYYGLQLYRMRGNDTGIAYSGSFKTVESVVVSTSSIVPGSTVYDTPKNIVLKFNKPIKPSVQYSFSSDKQAKIPSTAVVSPDGMILTISWSEPLDREASHMVRISNASSEDGGYIDPPYELAFYVSAGPKVVGYSVPSYKVSPYAEIDITFDQVLDPAQDIVSLVAFSAPATVSRISDNVVRIAPIGQLGFCTKHTITIADSVRSVYGIDGASATSYGFRTTCQQVGSIGTSVNGRAISSFAFGSGSTTLLYVGTTHGNEQGTSSLLYSWVDFLEQNPELIPADKRIVVIPRLNPDGYASSGRTNANNVDLNRNFPANDWKSEVRMPNGQVLPQGGGVSALSEPESAALAAFVRTYRPKMTFTYHSTGGLVWGNGAGTANEVAGWYADTVGYADETYAGTVFEHYDTTGSFEQWTVDKEGLGTVLVELFTHYNSEYGRHLPALKRSLSI